MQVLLCEVEDDVRLSWDTQDMNANEVVEHPPCSGILDASAFLVRKSRPRVLKRSADAVL